MNKALNEVLIWTQWIPIIGLFTVPYMAVAEMDGSIMGDDNQRLLNAAYLGVTSTLLFLVLVGVL